MSWDRLRYRGNKVWILLDETGEIVRDERGLAAMRYRPGDERTYTVRPDELEPLLHRAESGTPSGVTTDETIHVCATGAVTQDGAGAGIGVLLAWRGREREISRAIGKATPHEACAEALHVALEAIRRPEIPVRLHGTAARILGALQAQTRPEGAAHVERLVLERVRAFRDLRAAPEDARKPSEGEARVAALALRAAAAVPPDDAAREPGA